MPPRKTTKSQSPNGRNSSSPPTIRDVAAAAGVSVATVSNVINRRIASVGDLTREVVEREIERLGYRPQSHARNLRMARSRSLAMIIVDESELYLQDPFPAAVVAGFTAKLNELGYVTVLHGCRRDEFEKTAVVQRLGVDGYCLFLSGSEISRRELVRQMTAWDQPLVLIQETLSFPDADVCVVRQADYDGGAAVANHLLALGVKRVALVAPELDWPAVVERFNGVRETFRSSGSRVRLERISSKSEQFQDVFAAVKQAVAEGQRFDAIIGLNDQIAIAAMQALQDSGVETPGDTMIVGFNGLEFWQYCTPRLTTVRSSPYLIGEKAAIALVERLDTGRFSTADIVLPVQIQLGGTTREPLPPG